MNLIKTKNRNNMDSITLDSLLRLNLINDQNLNEISNDKIYEEWRSLKQKKTSLIFK